MKEDVPILFYKKEDCCGCSACFAACVTNAIEMSLDNEGFLYPHIDEEKCIGCRQCINVCPMKSSSANYIKNDFDVNAR